MAFDAAAVRSQFPILRRRIRTADGADRPLVYLDHGASTHAPQPVLDEVMALMANHYANVHRGNHTLSRESSERFEQAARTVAGFVGGKAESLVWASNTTQAIDLAAHMVAGEPGITVTTLSEHHSNDLPHRRRGPVLHVQVDEDGRLLLDDLREKMEGNQVKLLAVTGASNVTGLMYPIHKLARISHDAGARILVDAAQLYAHAPINVRPEGHPEHIDFLAAAGHKAYAPFGASFLLAPRELADAATPHTPGGGTVNWVTSDAVGFRTGPDRHLGGTPNIVGAVAFAAATRFLSRLGMDEVRRHERHLVARGLEHFARLRAEHRVALLGPTGARAADFKLGVFAFVVPNQTHAQVSTLLDHHYGIATRNGCFCAQPLLHKLLRVGDVARFIEVMERGNQVELPGAVRATVGVYNTQEELDFMADALAAVAAGKQGAVEMRAKTVSAEAS